jgi:hypothetical protein
VFYLLSCRYCPLSSGPAKNLSSPKGNTFPAPLSFLREKPKREKMHPLDKFSIVKFNVKTVQKLIYLWISKAFNDGLEPNSYRR